MNKRLRKISVFALLSLVLLVFIGFVEKKSAERRLSVIEVKIKSVADVYFVEEKEILDVVRAEFPNLQEGTLFREINLAKIEHKVESHPFVKNAEVFGDVKGNIVIEIQQHVPMARIVRPMAADAYISTEGLILPTSPKYTTRVLLLSGNYAEKLMQLKDINTENPGLLELIRFIQEDEFWKAQITELEIQRKRDIKLHQQVGRQVIEFGDASDISEKFEKVSLFYEEILPKKGWNTYQRVNVKYKDQIVCE